jgi:conjugal transfer/entry exclusion protein
MENSNYFFNSDNESKDKGRNFLTLFVFLTIVLTIACVILTWQLIEFRNLARQESAAKTTAISQKDEMLHKLKNLELEYDELSKEYGGLDSVFTKEKGNIQSLMSEIKNLKGSASNYQEKVEELEKRLKEYVTKIEDLKSKNESLSSENLKVKNTLDSSLNKNIEISSKYSSLADKIKAGAALRVSDQISEGVRLNSKKQEVLTRNARKAEKIRTSFTLLDNALATKGYKIIYVRIADPDGIILCQSESDTFTFKGKTIVYSLKKEIYYDNTSQDIGIYWEKTKDFKKGSYYIDIFIDDNLLGTSTISLD